MKTIKLITRLFVTLFIIFPIFAAKIYAAEEKRMNIVFAQDFMPFSWQNDNEIIQGVLIDFLNEILSIRMGIALQFEVYPWARAQLMVKKGERDAFFTIPNPERKTYANVSVIPFFSSDFILYTGANNPKYKELINIKTFDELKRNESLRHIYILGGGWHIKNLAGVKFAKRVTNSTTILQHLYQNVSDVYIEQALLVNYQIKLLNYQNKIIEIPTVMDSTHWHLCIGKKSSFIGLMPEINKVITLMEKNGSLEKLRDKIFNKYRSDQ